jgi:thiosulfate reductase cytochrome b subunit
LLSRRRRVPPQFNSKYNPLQRIAYFSIPIAGWSSVVTCWAIHKPMQLSWLSALLGGFDRARVWHFWLMCLFITFVVPHVILVFADGWDTGRSMITRWSKRSEMRGQSHEP